LKGGVEKGKARTNKNEKEVTLKYYWGGEIFFCRKKRGSNHSRREEKMKGRGKKGKGSIQLRDGS